MLPSAPPRIRPSAMLSSRLFSRHSQSATRTAMTVVMPTSSQRASSESAVSRPSDTPGFSTHLRLKKEVMVIERSGWPSRFSGYLITHFDAWSKTKTRKATTRATERLRRSRTSSGSMLRAGRATCSAMEHAFAAAAQAAILGDLGQMPPAAAAFQMIGARHFDPVALAWAHLGYDVDFREFGKRFVGEVE